MSFRKADNDKNLYHTIFPDSEIASTILISKAYVEKTIHRTLTNYERAMKDKYIQGGFTA